MTIINKTLHKSLFPYIDVGAVFLYQDNFYIKAQWDSGESYAVNLKTGRTYIIANDIPVTELKASLVVENLKEGE